jgi:hypothetical protein
MRAYQISAPPFCLSATFIEYLTCQALLRDFIFLEKVICVFLKFGRKDKWLINVQTTSPLLFQLFQFSLCCFNHPFHLLSFFDHFFIGLLFQERRWIVKVVIPPAMHSDLQLLTGNHISSSPPKKLCDIYDMPHKQAFLFVLFSFHYMNSCLFCQHEIQGT